MHDNVAQGADVASFEEALASLNVEGYEDAAVAEAKARRAAGEKATVACWEHRGCEGLMGLTAPMEQECPHSREDCYSPCPAECGYTACVRPWHKSATDIALIFDETVDRMAANKKSCYMCEYFIKNGPRVGEGSSEGRFVPESATRDSSNSVTIHLF